ncbi:unnamed protein product [Laminaria digitata]
MTKRSNYYNLGQYWNYKCPCHPKQQAVEECFKAKKTGMMMVSTGKITHFDVNFKSRFKMTQETIPFERYAFQKGITGKYTITIPYLGSQLVLQTKGKVPREFRDRNDASSVRKEIKITRTRLGEYYANVTFKVQQTCKFQSDKGDMMSFDPGSKTFLTYHAPDGTWGAIVSFKNQETLLKKADGLRSRLDTDGKKKGTRWRRRVRRRMSGVLQKIRNRTADLHNKVCSWVVNSSQVG